MQQIEVFTASNKTIKMTRDKINAWIEEGNIEVESVSMTTGSLYSSRKTGNFDEVEIIFTILYSKK